MQRLEVYRGGEQPNVPLHVERQIPPSDYIRPLGAIAITEAEAAPTWEVQHEAPGGQQLMLDLQWAYRGDARTSNEHLGLVANEDMRAIGHILKTVIEVLDGRRPMTHVQQSTSHTLYAAMQMTIRNTSRTTRRNRLRSLHAFQPAEGVIETCATVDDGQRAKALAARMERFDTRWQCTVLRLLQARRA